MTVHKTDAVKTFDVRPGDYVLAKVRGAQSGPRWGRVLGKRLPLVRVQMWSERLGRYAVGHATYHHSFLTVVEPDGADMERTVKRIISNGWRI